MKTLYKNKKTKYEDVVKTQKTILDELRQINLKMRIMGSLREFEYLAEKGRKFAKIKKIKSSDILKND